VIPLLFGLTEVQLDQLIDMLGIIGIPAIVAAYLVYRDRKKHRPIDATAAVAQGGADLVEAASDMSAQLMARIEQLLSRVEALEKFRESAEATMTAQSSEISLLRLVITIWSNWWMDLEARWDYHRLQDAPPPRPITPECKEVK